MRILNPVSRSGKVLIGQSTLWVYLLFSYKTRSPNFKQQIPIVQKLARLEPYPVRLSHPRMHGPNVTQLLMK